VSEFSSSRNGEAVPAAEAGGLLTIDLGALAANWRTLRDAAAGTECAAVIKADAYGLGIEHAAPALSAAGCRTFFVAHPSEALRVREVCGEAVVYVLNGFLPGTGPTYAGLSLRPVIGSFPELEDWAAFCRTDGLRLPAALHVDTGMNRLGFAPADAPALAADARLRDFEPALLMSHFASAEEVDDPLTARQIEAFAAVRAALPEIPASLCNSSGIFLPQHPFYDLVRPGYALYGGNPVPGRDNPMRPVVRLEARVLQVRSLPAGETAGYNGAWRAPSPRRLATLSTGYADGYPRAASRTDAKDAAGIASGAALVAGRLCPFAGRVSMDLIIVDVTGVPEAEIRRGTLATLIGDALTVDEVGRRAGTIGYEVLTSLGGRYARRYL
jgi:alanine racemase